MGAGGGRRRRKSLVVNDLRVGVGVGGHPPKQEEHDSKNLHQHRSSASASASSKPLATVTLATQASDCISKTSSHVMLSLITGISIPQPQKSASIIFIFLKKVFFIFFDLGLALFGDSCDTISVMRNFLIEYRPAVHEGRENLKGLVFNYTVEVEEQFANRQNPSCKADTVCAGITARCTETGEWKRFRWDCILSMVAN